jgi:Tetracyclin repressor-like, C-terminal domain
MFPAVPVPDTGDLCRDLTEFAVALDIDHAILTDLVSAPIYYRVLITGATADRHYAERLVRAVLDGALTARPGPGNGVSPVIV